MENIEAMLCAYIEGDLDASGRAQIEKHLQEHPQHRKLIQELAAMRDLVRGLPRIKAPLDVGESLRGKVERSILLDDSPGTDLERVGGSRWPQIFAVAAIFLLCASLCLVLYKALGPTLKPPVFTENVTPKLPANATPSADALTPPPVATKQEALAAVVGQLDDRNAGFASPSAVTPGSLEIHRALPARQQQLMTLAQINNQLNNVEVIRRRLRNSGYDIGSVSANSSPPVLMVVSSTDPSATNAQVAQFLSNSNGISWKRVPFDAETKSVPSTLPSDNSGRQLLPLGAGNKGDGISASPVPTTQPASNIYMASGFTSQQADALRQSLAGQQNGAEVQVSLQSAAVLATTQPSSPIPDKDLIESFHFGAALTPTTEPSEAAHSSVELAAPSTMPTNLSAGALSPTMSASRTFSAGANGVLGANNSAALQGVSKSLQPMDAVIVVQSASIDIPAPAVFTTPATQPSPSTQP